MFVVLDRTRAISLICAGLALAVVTWPSEASAQGFFQAFFGAFLPPAAHQSLPPRTQAYADPTQPVMPEAPAGRSAAYCVRMCDGRYFPIQRNVSATPIQLCNALCPASKTKVFSGGEIHGATATDGTRYADLANAFVFRERLVANCTCNGKDAFGLAPLDVAADPTLRPGDVVTTENGLMAVTGARPKKGSTRTAEFTPVDKSNLSADVRRKLTAVTVAPAR
jgi:Protein of unknown function (DUF2865)